MSCKFTPPLWCVDDDVHAFEAIVDDVGEKEEEEDQIRGNGKGFWQNFLMPESAGRQNGQCIATDAVMLLSHLVRVPRPKLV